MSKFENLQISSLNKNEMSREEFLYHKYKNKYLNLKREIDGGAPIFSSAANSLLKGTKTALGKAASATTAAAASATTAAASATTAAASATIKGTKRVFAKSEFLSNKLLTEKEVASFKEDSNNAQMVKDAAKKAAEEAKFKIKINSITDKIKKFNIQTDEDVKKLLEVIEKFTEIKTTNLQQVLKNTTDTDNFVIKLNEFIVKIKGLNGKNKTEKLGVSLTECNNYKEEQMSFTDIKNSGVKLEDCKQIIINAK